ncbi:MAG: U32 family peptidase [Oscillospiraceae bacterium]|nr:U32 family peptidase [Oscillospiraceae bacterium]
MKLTAGLGSVQDYPQLCEAGADELFCGYVPPEWIARYGVTVPENRREVLAYPVQIGSLGDMEILAGMVRRLRRPVRVTFNALYYLPEQYPLLARQMADLDRLGFHDFIVADPALLLYLRKKPYRFHLSGECADYNRYSMSLVQTLGVTRCIFHRKMPIADMAACIRAGGAAEYEAFLLNERCHYTGAFCSSLHCDALPPFCRVPYRLGFLSEHAAPPQTRAPSARADDCVGSSGCGLCALWQLRATGITHLKIVGRGNSPDAMTRDLRAARRALSILADSPSEAAFRTALRASLFSGGCSGACYYPLEET